MTSLLIVCLIIAMAGVFVFRQQIGRLRTLVFQPRAGCTLAEVLEGERLLIKTREDTTALLQASSIIDRDPAGYVLWHTPRGDFWAPENDDSWFYVLAEVELDPYATGGPDSLRDQVVLDCGAHVGTYTRQVLEAGAKLVVAIEPGSQQVYCLRKTFAREIAAGRVRIEQKGVWNQDGELTLYETDGKTAGDSVLGPDMGSSEKISVTTIDRLVSTLHLDSVDVIKMDIEGAEPQALFGASETLKKYKPRLAIASYHTIDEYRHISDAVLHANPGYRSSQLGCRVDLGYSVPLTMLFN